MEEYNVWRIIGTVVCAAYIAWIIAALIVSHAKAKRIGIIRVKYPTSPAWFAGAAALTLLMWGSFAFFTAEYNKNNRYLSDMQTRGIAAVAERHNKSIDELLSGAEFVGANSYEDIYVERESASYTKIVEQNRIIMLSDLVGSVMVTLIAMSGCGAYITKGGIMTFTGFKPLKTAARTEGEKICFYTEKKPGRIWAKFPADEKNRALFSEFLIN